MEANPEATNSHGVPGAAAGMDADLVCLNRETLALQWTMVKGRRFDPE